MGVFFSRMQIYQAEAMYERNAKAAEAFVKQSLAAGIKVVTLGAMIENQTEAEKMIMAQLTS